MGCLCPKDKKEIKIDQDSNKTPLMKSEIQSKIYQSHEYLTENNVNEKDNNNNHIQNDSRTKSPVQKLDYTESPAKNSNSYQKENNVNHFDLNSPKNNNNNMQVNLNQQFNVVKQVDQIDLNNPKESTNLYHEQSQEINQSTKQIEHGSQNHLSNQEVIINIDQLSLNNSQVSTHQILLDSSNKEQLDDKQQEINQQQLEEQETKRQQQEEDLKKLQLELELKEKEKQEKRRQIIQQLCNTHSKKKELSTVVTSLRNQPQIQEGEESMTNSQKKQMMQLALIKQKGKKIIKEMDKYIVENQEVLQYLVKKQDKSQEEIYVIDEFLLFVELTELLGEQKKYNFDIHQHNHESNEVCNLSLSQEHHPAIGRPGVTKTRKRTPINLDD